MNASVIDIIEFVTEKELKLNYECKTAYVNYSISDTGGRIIQHGNYDCLTNNIVDIHHLPAGTFILCIIDGDSYCKTRFKKNR